MNRTPILISLVFYLMSYTSFSQTADKMGLPYFYEQNNTDVDGIPLSGIKAEVSIAGNISVVTLKQTFVNKGSLPIEAKYVFPTSTTAAIHEMKMIVGKRTINGVIKERDAAKKTYEKARDKGQVASLLQQSRPNVFEMNVANILPGDTIRVELTYSDMVAYENGLYRFNLPTVVGPRYNSDNQLMVDARNRFVENPYLKEGAGSTYTYDIQFSLDGVVPITEARSTSHFTKIKYLSASAIELEFEENPTVIGTKDFVFEYRLQDEKIQTGITYIKGEKENYFTLMLQPPKEVKSWEKPSREYLFLVDVSGSMSGAPHEVSQKIVKELLSRLDERDRFNITLFSSSNKSMNKVSVSATQENIKEGISFINSSKAGGGTELYAALEHLYKQNEQPGFSKNIVVITDGYISAEDKCFALTYNNLNKSNLYSFGVGSSVNRYLIEGLAEAGKGEEFIVTNFSQSNQVVAEFITYIESPVLTDIRLDFGNNEVYDVVNSKPHDLSRERPIYIHGKYKGQLNDAINISGYTHQKVIWALKPELVASKNQNVLSYIWARQRIKELEQQKLMFDDDFKKEITSIGLAYGMVTPYTSYVAVDKQENRSQSQELISVKQPLPLPDGVSNAAVGGSFASRMNATGATVRATGGSDIDIYSPASSKILGKSAFIMWKNDGNSPLEYTVEVKDIYDKVLFTASTLDNKLEIDFKSLSASNPSGLFIVNVHKKDDPDFKSADIGMKIDRSVIEQSVIVFIPVTTEDYLTLASLLENKGYLVDAISTCIKGLLLYPENEKLQSALEALIMYL